MKIKILTVIFSLFITSLFAAGSSSDDSAKTNYGKDYKSAIKLIRSKDYDKAIRKLKTLQLLVQQILLKLMFTMN